MGVPSKCDGAPMRFFWGGIDAIATIDAIDTIGCYRCYRMNVGFFWGCHNRPRLTALASLSPSCARLCLACMEFSTICHLRWRLWRVLPVGVIEGRAQIIAPLQEGVALSGILPGSGGDEYGT